MISRMRHYLIIPDAHNPYMDLKAFETMLAYARSQVWDGIVIQGDWVDCYSASFHEKDPARRLNLAWEFDVAYQKLRQIDDQLKLRPDGRKVFLMGNHEDRLNRYIVAHASALHGLKGLSVQEQLELDENGWEAVPYKQSYQLGKVRLSHDFGKAGGNAIRDAERDMQGNAIIGHVHRMGVHYAGNHRGDRHFSAAFGWLGDFAKIDYMHRDVARRDWIHGFGTLWVQSNGLVHVQAHPILNGSVCVDGKLYSIRDSSR